MTARDAAFSWCSRGFFPIPVPHREKKPELQDWQQLRITAPEVPRYFTGPAQNIGLLLGEPSGLADVDLDCVEAITCAPRFMPDTAMIFGRKSKPSSHWFYRCDPPVASRVYRDPVSKNVLLEIRCLNKNGAVGHHTVVPPSVHPSGEEIRFEATRDGEPASAPAGALETAANLTGAASLLARHWPGKGGRHEAQLSLAGGLARARWSLRDAKQFARAIFDTRRIVDSDYEDIIDHDFDSTFTAFAAGREITGWKRLSEMVDPQAVKTACKWLGVESEVGEWPAPIDLAHELPPVQEFRPAMFPAALGAFVVDIAERMQVPMDFPAAALLISLAAAVSRRATIQPKIRDTGWCVVPNLFGGIVASPGFMKSPVIQAATRTLIAIEKEWRLAHEEEVKQYEEASEEAELRHSAWKDLYKAAIKKNGAVTPRPENLPKAPKPPRIIVHDATFEALHEIMKNNPAGILVIRDELTGWFSQMDRAGREGERAFALEAWNGDTSHTIDRIGRGSIHVEACCMSLFGGIQPARLRSYLSDAVKDGPTNDGLIQRFQLVVWPDADPAWTLIDRQPDAVADANVRSILRNLLSLSADRPLRFRFADDAQEVFYEWWTELEKRIRRSDMLPEIVSHLSKYRSLMPSLALLFELAERAMEGFDGFVGRTPPSVTEMEDAIGSSEGFAGTPPSPFSETELVHIASAKRAVAWCEYLETHAHRVYSCITSPALKAARDLAGKIRSKKVGAGGYLTCREVYINGWTGLDNPEAVRHALEILEDSDWVRRETSEPTKGGGRPSARYAVNPRIWKA